MFIRGFGEGLCWVVQVHSLPSQLSKVIVTEFRVVPSADCVVYLVICFLGLMEISFAVTTSTVAA